MVLSLAMPLFEQRVSDPEDEPREFAAFPGGSLHEDQISSAVALLIGAKAPMIVVGRGANGPAAAAAEDLSRRIGAALTTTVPAKAALAGSSVGLIGMMAGPESRDRLAAADVVVVLGVALDRYNTDGGNGLQEATVIRIDRREPTLLWDPPSHSTVHVTGDCAEALTLILRGLPPSRVDATTLPEGMTPGAERAAALAERMTSDGPNPWAVVNALDEALPSNAYVVIGIGHFWYFVTPYLSSAERHFQFGHGFAMIGQALPLGVGAAVARPAGQVVVLEGDGSIPMNLVELQTAVRLGVDLLVIVLDNSAYGSEVHKLALAGLDPDAAAFAEPINIVAVAEAFGAVAMRAGSPAEVSACMAELLPRKGVRVLVASISRSTMSEVYERQHG